MIGTERSDLVGIDSEDTIEFDSTDTEEKHSDTSKTCGLITDDIMLDLAITEELNLIDLADSGGKWDGCDSTDKGKELVVTRVGDSAGKGGGDSSGAGGGSYNDGVDDTAGKSGDVDASKGGHEELYGEIGDAAGVDEDRQELLGVNKFEQINVGSILIGIFLDDDSFKGECVASRIIIDFDIDWSCVEFELIEEKSVALELSWVKELCSNDCAWYLTIELGGWIESLGLKCWCSILFIITWNIRYLLFKTFITLTERCISN